MTEPRPGKHLLVASTGGHLAQLAKWSERIGSSDDSLWVTFDNNQSRSMLAGKRVLFVRYVAPRDTIGTLRALAHVWRAIDWKNEDFAAAISTGAALAVSGLLASRARGLPSFYFESVSRVNGPSLSGRIVSFIPGIRLSCQYEAWAGKRWKYRGTLFDNYVTGTKPPIDRPRLFVTLGTIKPYRFDSLIDAVLETGLADEDTVWQLGSSYREGLPGRIYDEMDATEFDCAAKSADVVVTHSGVGTIMKFLDFGLSPVVVPRRKSRSEHVDDHQLQIARLLMQRNIGHVCEVGDLDRLSILESTGSRTISGNSGSAVQNGEC